MSSQKKVSFKDDIQISPEEQFDIEKSNHLDDTIESYNQKIDNIKDQNCDSRCILSIILLICIIIVWYVVFSVLSYNHSDTKSSQLTERLIAHGSSHKLTCDDNEWGCCYIYHKCNIVNNNINYKRIKISPYKISANDNLKSNCPSLKTLVNKYNNHYGNDTCGEFGCCNSVNIACDEAIHNYKKKGVNEMIDYFKNNHNQFIGLKVPKTDKHGTNCWNYNFGLYEFISKYQDDYPSLDDTYSTFINVIVVVVILVCIIKSAN